MGGWSTPRPGRFNAGKDPVPIVRLLGRPKGRSEGMWKISPPPGFDLRTAQPVESRFTDCSIPAQMSCGTLKVQELLHCVVQFPDLLCLRVETFTASCDQYKHTEITCDRFTLHLSVSLAAPNKRNMSVANPSGSSFVCK